MWPLMGQRSSVHLFPGHVPSKPRPLHTSPFQMDLKINRVNACIPSAFQKPVSVRNEFPFDRPKKKTIRRDRLCPPQRRPGLTSSFTVNQANIKQYDFHSSGEDDSPPPVSVSSRDYPTVNRSCDRV